MPEVSVIMSVYNAQQGEILEHAVNSILQQTFTDFELIICDDGSTDKTWELLKRIAGTDSRIGIIHNDENKKAGYARNTCLKVAKGHYIAIMDGDDISHPERIERQRKFLKKNKMFAFVGTRGEFFIDNVGDDGERYWFCSRPYPKDFLFSLPFVHASCMFRSEVLRKVGGYDYSSKVIRAEDYDMLLRIYGEGYVGGNLSEVLYYIRRDKAQFERRKYRYRFHEAYIKYRGYKKLGLLPRGMIYVLKPLIVGLIPTFIYTKLQKKYYGRK